MSKGKLERWALLAEIAGGVAVVISLPVVTETKSNSNAGVLLKQKQLFAQREVQAMAQPFVIELIEIYFPAASSAGVGVVQ